MKDYKFSWICYWEFKMMEVRSRIKNARWRHRLWNPEHSETWKQGPRLPRKEDEHRSLFWARKLPTGCKSLGLFSWISKGTELLKILQASMTLNDRRHLAKGVMRHTKFILNTKYIFQKFRARVFQSPIKLTQGEWEFWFQFSTFLGSWSVYIVCNSVSSCSNLKLH